MNRKHFLITTLISVVLLTVVLVPISSQPSGSYDPWLDYNEDGIIDVNDLSPLGQAYGSSGDPTKNVNVTNWPVEKETFPKNLLLRGTKCWGLGGYNRLLIDQDTPYPYPSHTEFYALRDYEKITTTLTTTLDVLYEADFVYEKVPTEDYQILGMPTVTLTYNVTNSPSASFLLYCNVQLGRISTTGFWTQLVAFGTYARSFSGVFTWQVYDWFNERVLTPITVGANQRLAVRIKFTGKTTSGTTNLTLEIFFNMNTDEFVVSIPIVEN